MFDTLYQEFIYKRTYARWIDSENRREDWNETVDRYKDFFMERVPKDHIPEFIDVIQSVKSLDVMPSMRALWVSGKALSRDNICSYNCAYIIINNIRAFAEMLYILMNGTGVGFSVERQYINQLPTIPNKFKNSNNIIVFADSKRGWAEGYYKVLISLYKGEIPKYDLSRVRPAGARLKVFGGLASGPGPLEALIKFTINMIVNNKGKKLSSINCHDICCTIAQIVVVGSVRRSACISLSNLSDDRMAKAKSGFFWQNDPQRLMSNNSVAYTEKPDSRKFLSEWIKLIESKTGERGLFNRVGAKLLASKSGRRDSSYEFGINPCQPEWATLCTKDGIKQFKDVNIGDEIWSEDGWVKIINKQSSGIKNIYRYRTNAGVFYGTDSHRIVSNGKKVMVKDASSIDSLCCESYSTKFLSDVVIAGMSTGYENELPKTSNIFVPSCYEYNNNQIIKSFLRGFYTVCGSIVEADCRITLRSESEQLTEDIQTMLSAIGISSYIIKSKPRFIKFNNGVYKIQKKYYINITTDADIFYETVGFIQKYKMEKLKECLVNKKKGTEKVTYDINSVEYISTEEVYNITVDGKSHTYWTGGCDVSNCAEVILRPMEFCNLTEVVIRKDDNLKTLKSKIRNATILGCLQSTLTDFKFINRTWKQNCEEERLLGVSLTGVMDNPVLNNINKEMKIWLHEMKEEAISTAEDWSRYLNINMPTAITAIKPAGTTSQLTNTSSGIHARYAPYYLRRVRVSSLDPLAKFLLNKGVPVKPEVDSTMENTSNYVFEFPIKSPDTSRMRDELTTIQQLELYKVYMLYYVEHNISMTVYVKDHEWPEVASWVYKNWDSICGLSFLPYDTGVYKLAPYTELTEEEYIELDASFPKDIDFKDLNKFETEDKTEGAQVLACTGGACEI